MTTLTLGHLYTQPWSSTEYHLALEVTHHGKTTTAPAGKYLLLTRFADGLEALEILSPYALETIEVICKTRTQWGYVVVIGEAGRQLGVNTLSLATAQALHQVIGAARVGDTKKFAHQVLGREVPSFTGLTHYEAKRLEQAAGHRAAA